MNEDKIDTEMQPEISAENPSGDASGKRQDTIALIVKTALRTLFCAVVALVFAAATLAVCFPYDAMKVYIDLGMKSPALECAERYISPRRAKYEKEDPALDSRFVTALYNACELSVSLYTDAKTEREKLERAEQIRRYTEEYLSVAGISENLDELSRYAVAHQPYYYHASLYSYRDFLVRYNYIARCQTGDRADREGIIYDGKVSTIQMLESTLYNQDLGANIDNDFANGRSYTIDAIAEAFNMLSAMIIHDFSATGVDDFSALSENDFGTLGGRLSSDRHWFYPLADRRQESRTTILLERIEEKFDMLKEKALAMPENTKWEMLDKLYVFRALSGFADNVWCAFMTLAGNEIYNNGRGTIDSNRFLKWQGMNSVDGYSGSMRDYYNKVLVPRYVGKLAE